VPGDTDIAAMGLTATDVANSDYAVFDATAVAAGNIKFRDDPAATRMDGTYPGDFESPVDVSDADGKNNTGGPGAKDNLYSIFVKAKDALGNVKFQVVGVQITNVNELPYFVTTSAHLERDEDFGASGGVGSRGNQAATSVLSVNGDNPGVGSMPAIYRTTD